MKTIKLLIIGMVCLFTSFQLACANGPDIRLTTDQIANMSSDARNALFNEIKKQAELDRKKAEEEQNAKLQVDEKAIAKLSAMDVESFQAKLGIVADALNAFC